MNNKKYHTVRTIPKSNIKIIERGKFDITNTPLKTIRTTFASAIFRQFGSCFGLFDVAG
jgi:hypothetical protein